nr:hypothetical protein [Tanacetum cinerariifolium]
MCHTRYCSSYAGGGNEVLEGGTCHISIEGFKNLQLRMS